MRSKSLRLSLIMLFVILACFSALWLTIALSNQSISILYTTEISKQAKEDKYTDLNDKCDTGKIVFFGDSITEMYKTDKYFPESDIYNRGISSETSAELLDRVYNNVILLAPSKVFILVGANDLNKYYSVEEIAQNVVTIVKRIKRFLPECKVYVESVLPVNENAKVFSKFVVSRRKNEDINALNTRLATLSIDHPFYFIDTHSALKDDTGALNAEMTIDGLHLNRKGYAALTEVLTKYV